MNTPLRTWSTLIAALACLVLGGCSSMLPSNKKETISQWNSYDEAERCLVSIKPYEATRKDVHQQGLDPHTNSAVTVLHYADVLQRFNTGPLITTTDIDRGIRDCLRAGKRCSGYAIAVKKVDQNRSGNFWLDSLNFKRETETKGWSIDALLLFVDDQLVYELIGGQPVISEYEVQKNPLGPLQGWGDRR